MTSFQPPLPIGLGPLDPLDAYGPRVDDNVVLRWHEQTLAAIRGLKRWPPVDRTSQGNPPVMVKQLLDGDRAHPRVGPPREVFGQQLPGGLVQALQLPFAQGEPDQRRRDALVTEWSTTRPGGTVSVSPGRSRSGSS